MLKCDKGLSLIIGGAWPPDRKTRLTSHVMYRLRRSSARERVVELQPLILRYIWQGGGGSMGGSAELCFASQLQ